MSDKIARRTRSSPQLAERAVLRDKVIVRLMEAERALKLAETVQQAKVIADVAEAQRVFVRRQQLGRDVEDRAYGLKTRALVRLGELLRDMDKNGGGRPEKTPSKSEGVLKPQTYADLGIDYKVAAIAQQLAELPTETREAIANREIKITEARRQQRRTRQPQQPLPPGTYRIVYADPPWHYGNKGAIGDGDNYGRAERHYPSMTIAELCALEVCARVAPDAVLFLWVTSPILAECWPVIEAWGFTYKASIVWDKVRHNFGNYVSVRHELLLIATRGSCLPDCPTPMPDSVISIPRSSRHSQKPEAFRDLIDRLYPAGPAIELFSRWKPPTGSRWKVHGNERLAVSA